MALVRSPGAHDHRGAVLEVGGDGAEAASAGRSKLLMRATGSVSRRSVSVSSAPGSARLRQHHVAAMQSEGKLDEEGLVLLLAPQRQVLARRPVAEGVLPVGRASSASRLTRAETAGVQPAHHRAHAGAGDRIDRHVHVFEHLEDADVRDPARPAAGEHQPDARPRRRSRRPYGGGFGWRGRRGGGRRASHRAARRRLSTPRRGVTARVELTVRRIAACGRPRALGSRAVGAIAIMPAMMESSAMARVRARRVLRQRLDRAAGAAAPHTPSRAARATGATTAATASGGASRVSTRSTAATSSN